MKIYVASSWRNTYQPKVVTLLRSNGHEVYDFRGGGDGWKEDSGVGGFSWSSVDPEWQTWPNNVLRYQEGLNHPNAVAGFERDMDALKRSDVCIMVMPCGPSASMEMGWACGARKLVAVYMPEIREPDLMIKMADLITIHWSHVEDWLNSYTISVKKLPLAIKKLLPKKLPPKHIPRHGCITCRVCHRGCSICGKCSCYTSTIRSPRR